MFVLYTVLLIALDQATKLWAANAFPLGSTGMRVGLGFNFTYVQNTGAAFGIFQGVSIPLGFITLNGTHLLGLLSAVVSAFIFVYLLRNAKTMPILQRSALTLILAGAIGNMIDRFRLSYVIDFIHFKLPNFNFPVFNVADSCVVIGAGLLILSSLLVRPPQKPASSSSEPNHTVQESHGSEPYSHERSSRQLDDIEPPQSLPNKS